jgi:hypothetical protein
MGAGMSGPTSEQMLDNYKRLLSAGLASIRHVMKSRKMEPIEAHTE